MIGRERKISIFDLLVAYSILYTVMPIIARLTSTYLTTYFYLFITLVLIVMCLSYDANREITFLLPFIAYLILSFFIRTSSIVMWGYECLLFVLPILLGYILLVKPDINCRFLMWVLIIALGVTIITTIAGCIRFPNASRSLAAAQSSTDLSVITYSMANIGGYDFVYQIVVLYPVAIYAYKKKRINIFLMSFCVVAAFALTIYTEYTIAFLLVTISTCLLLFKRNFTFKDLMIVLVIVAILYLLFHNIFSSALLRLSEMVSSETVSSRLATLAGGRTAIEGSDDNRIRLYERSLNAFFHHPIMGSALFDAYSTGGHSHILDTLGQFGVIGGAVLIGCYKRIFRTFYGVLKNEFGYGYICWSFIQVLILSTVNTGFWLMELAFIIPLLFKVINEEEKL